MSWATNIWSRPLNLKLGAQLAPGLKMLRSIPVIHIYPEQEYIMNVLKDTLFLYGRLYVWPKTSKILQAVVEGNFLRIVEQPYLLTAKACKNQNLRMR